MSNPFRYFNSSPEIIRLAVLMYVKYPLSLRNVWSEAVQENALILAPLESRDARRAGDLMRQHVARTGEVVRTRWTSVFGARSFCVSSPPF